ncbi:biorientation of chromosomes in cell division protein 1-like 1 isoform X2 [Planococcus citri]|uniref:biorientation of chromosomes in cell division protein 1-like 1 isoform X2 n=1 Tax=Planococcus citri TaxID=170843 RepID=UPI0031F8FE3A
MEYVPGDPILIKNIVTQLKSQGIFDQIRKECIADVDTKPAYQNLCHRADNQVSKFLSKVKWGPDLHKNQTRENIRKQVNGCTFVEPGIAIIVDQLVNPRINTVLVPKVEDMLYKYLGIPREVDNTPSQRETKSSNEKGFFRDVPDSGVPGVSKVDIYDTKKEAEKYRSNWSREHSGMDNQRNDSSTSKMPSTDDKSSRDKSSSIKVKPFDNVKDSGKSIKPELEKHFPKVDMKGPPLSEFDSESSDDEISPVFEPNEKSDNDMSIGSADSNFSEIIFEKASNEPEIPGVEDKIDIICKADESKIITEHDDSLDSVRSSYSTPPAPEKVHISPIEIPKTPTINYETSDDSDDHVKNKQLLDPIALDAAEPVALEVPEVNFEKIEKVLEDNIETKPVETIETKPPKEEDKYKEKNRLDDAKKKSKYKDDKPAESKEKHTEKKSEHKSDKDRKYDKHRSEQRSKDRDKDRHRHDSSSSKSSHSRKDDKSHHSRDHSKSSDHDRKSKSEHRKDDSKKDDKSEHKKDSTRSEYKKDDRSDSKKDDKSEHRKDSRNDRKKEDDKKHSPRDDKDKDRKKDPYKASSSDDKKSSKSVKSEDSKHKYDKPRDDKKSSSKNVDSHKSKKKDEDPKKSRSQCNIDEKKKTDRRSSDRDSSGPSTSNSSSIHHTSSQQSSRSDRDKGSSKHRHSSSSSSSHKTKRNDSEHAKNHSEKLPSREEKPQAVEDDLELILESSPDKGFQNNTKSEPNFSAREIFPEKANDQSNDHIEDMMNEMFQPTNIKPVLKKPKIAKNFADIRRIMKLRKLYEEDFKSKSSEQNADETTTDADKSTAYKVKLRRTVDYFVMRRFGKNGNYDKCKELTNGIIETLTDVKLNIRRVDRQYSLIDGSCTLSDDETDRIFGNDVNHAANNNTKLCDNDEIDSIPIIEDERANLILEDLANSYTDPNFKLGDVPDESKFDQPFVKTPSTEEDAIKIVQSEIKANGAKTRLPKQLTLPENDAKEMVNNVTENKTPTVKAEEDTSLGLKSISDAENKTRQVCDQLEQIQDPVLYLPIPDYNSDFMQFANELLNESYNFNVENLSIEMDYPEAYDFMFVDCLGAKVIRSKSDDPKTSPCKYNSEIITKKLGDNSIMLRIKKTDESADQKILNKKRKLADDSGIEMDNPEPCNLNPEPVKKKKRTLGIKRTIVNPLKIKLTSGQLNDSISNGLAENTVNVAAAKAKASPVPKKVSKVNKVRAMSIANAIHKKSESESSDCRRNSAGIAVFFQFSNFSFLM